MNNLLDLVHLKSLKLITNGKSIQYSLIEFIEEKNNISHTGYNKLSRSGSSTYPNILAPTLTTITIKDINTDKTSNINDINKSIIKFYYDKCLSDNYKTLDLSELEDDQQKQRKITSHLLGLSNKIAMKSRVGIGDVLIIPSKIWYTYLKVFMSLPGMRFFIDYNNLFDNKIIITRLNDIKNSMPTVILFTDTNINERYNKLYTLLSKIKGYEREIEYGIFQAGNIKNNIQILELKNFD